ncbi:hypothetical protein VTK56DRAFT_6194 [Thermocarpiscus australiensis]
MDLNGVPMCHIHIDLGDDVNFSSNNLALASISPYTSSSYGPQTPTSGHSTPVRSRSFGSFNSSFSSPIDTFPMDLTPPPSATSTYFSMPVRTGEAFFPVTPSRSQLGFSGHSLSGCGSQLTPSQTMDGCLFMSDLGSQPFLSSPPGLAEANRSPSPDAWSVWPQTPDSPSPRPSVSSGRGSTARLVNPEEARRRTTALQQVQQCSQPSGRTRTRTREQLRALMAGGGSISVEDIQPGHFKCEVKDCKAGPFRRNEHLKRHIQSAHNGMLIPCKWCKDKDKKPFNRRDNWLQHLRLHTLPRGKGGRVKFSPGAVKEYEEERKRISARRRHTVKSTKKRAQPRQGESST